MNAVTYWANAAREQSRWRIALRSQARATRSCQRSAALYDAALRCADRRDVFIAEARRVRAGAAA